MDDNFGLGYAMGQDSGSGGGGGFSGGGWGDWIFAILIFAMIFGGGRGWGFGGGGGFGGGEGFMSAPWATQADVRAAVDQQTLISKLDQQTYGLADSTYALNNTLVNGFHGIDREINNLGYQMQQCCCDTRGAIKDVNVGIERTGWNLSKQISDCCCDMEKMNMQNRFDAAQANCGTLQAIDKLGDRILGYLTNKEAQDLRDEVQGYRLAASQARQNEYLVNQLRPPVPIPSYVVPNPNSFYGNPLGIGYQVQNNDYCRFG